VIELKSLVSPAYLDENKKHLLQKLQSLISNENKQAPYSDEKLLQLLKAKGSKISRRTLTKYRHQLKIPDARRRFFS
jgi:RNA polymerase sigma-54 factor